MKRLIKAALRRIWKATGAIRRPLVRKLDAHLAAQIGRGLDERLSPAAEALARLGASVDRLRDGAAAQAHELDLVLNGVVREIARLQMLVEELHQSVDEVSSAGRLSVVGAGEEPDVLAGPEELMRVG